MEHRRAGNRRLIKLIFAHRFFTFSLFLRLLQESHGQVLGRGADELKLLGHEPDLLDKFMWGWLLTEFDCFDESILKLSTEDVRSFDFEIVVTQSDKVGDCVLFHVGAGFEESFNLPFLVVSRVHFLVAAPSRDHCDTVELLVSFRHEFLCRHLDPSFSSVGHYVDLAILFGSLNEVTSHSVQLFKLALDVIR